ncbi:rhodanese-like domain-containing protein [Thiorhodovibrio frisius]|uniref:Rhodanese-related sulfurtransferase n=1 Tax=Thiorhodovibrio frisius TaxID=631362 RepID=H8Z393_9GAMM|nr:rhodanese-like domain-containing protein [Thiorhodovibrio frisius]EIC21801.1 Rhodanese-related sulfurtransferase [Thiorhodovibrio frisius]WPL21771.1 putative adenylyltransferase/sulfurtransferase MoeZ [Thiorhodovibrio frisius]
MNNKKIIELMHQRFGEFRGVPVEALQTSLPVFRLFELREGEQLRIGGSVAQDRLLVVMGRVKIGDAIWDPARSAERSLVMPSSPAQIEISAIDDSLLCHLDLDLLDILLAQEQLLETSSLSDQRMETLRHTSLMRKLPLENVEQALTLLREQRLDAGAEPVKMGRESNHFFVLLEGAAELWRIDDEEGIPMKAEDLGPGTCFGEEGLLMGSPSPVTVRLTADCLLMTLERDEFKRLLAQPMLREVDVHVAKTMRERGYRLLDVRMQEEYDEMRIPGAQLMPLSQLKQRAAELDSQREYVVYCRSGRRSSVATFLLSNLGYQATNMQGGITAWTFDLEGDDVETTDSQ